MTSSMRLRALAGIFALVTGLGTLGACGDAGGSTVTSKDGKGEVDHGTAVESSPSTGTLGEGLPEGFPKDRVPLVDETVVNGVKGSPGGPFAWSVVMTSKRSVADLSAEVTRQYAAAGYRSDRSTELGDVSIHQFSSDAYRVGVTIARTGDGITVTYLVKARG